MCGIAGIFARGRADARRVFRMANAMRHRGPDDEGYVALGGDGSPRVFAGPETAPGALRDWSDCLPDCDPPLGADLVLGARRLAILDLSPSGHQPLSSDDGRAWIVHNGEIYNYIELRDELVSLGHAFRGGSDTEVALAAYREWGLDCFERFNGMWALAIWDDAEPRLVLSRDRFGVKPLYVADRDGAFLFASEIKALLVAGVPAAPRAAPLAEFLSSGRIDATGTGTCFAGIEQLAPGTSLVVPLDGSRHVVRYYDLEARLRDASDAVPLATLLEDAVRLRLRSDVPVGSCLSGGVDSSTIVALAQAHGAPAAPLHTFTFAAEAPPHDETAFARAVADAVGAIPFVTRTPPDLVDQLEAAVRDNEEPIGAGSVVAQRQVMALAHEHGLKVLLDGQGGDEVFAGYPYYVPAQLADLVLSRRPDRALLELRAAAANGIGRAGWLARATLGELRRAARTRPRLRSRQLDDVRFHLPALLHYEDRNSMSFSIETRLPFLDYRVVELGLALDGRAKLGGGWTKLALRRAFSDRLPEPVVWRRDKVQFSVPQQRWLAGPLRELAHDLLPAADRPAEAAAAGDLLARLDSLDAADADRLWRLLALELWYRAYVEAPVRAAAPATA
jgi:asparagine synthase (glutamine-hydrolysing)